MTDTQIWQLSATRLAALTRSGQISATEATTAAITRMHAVNPALNAVVVDLGEQALARARALDAAGVARGALHGVPVTIKINVDQAGQATSNGVPALKDWIAPADAPLVRHLLDAGAVIIGRTNTPEFSYRVDTDNPLFGRTRNPWHPDLSAGGSSGGAGVAVMAGIGALAQGNDIGGSLRYPAFASGAVTVKPGLGRVPAFNPSQPAERGMLAQSMSVQGLIARHAEDLDLAMPVMIQPDPQDPFHVPLPWQGPPLDGPIRIGFTTETLDFPLHPEVAAALDAAREALIDAGYRVEPVTPPVLRELAQTALRALLTEAHLMGGADMQRLGSPTFTAIMGECLRHYPPFDPEAYLQALARRSHFARQWSLLFAEYPLVLTPFLPAPIFTAGRDAEIPEGAAEVILSGFWATAMNFMGLPAGIVPTRLATHQGRTSPVGVQIVGRRWREDLITTAMIAIEHRLGPMAPGLWAQTG